MRETSVYAHIDRDGEQDYVILLTLDYGEEDGRWVGLCLELGTSAYGESFDEARKEVHVAVALQLSETERLGFVWDYLRDNRVSPIENSTASAPGFSLVS